VGQLGERRDAKTRGGIVNGKTEQKWLYLSESKGKRNWKNKRRGLRTRGGRDGKTH